ncbi:putative transcriptional regulator [Saccharomonospora marina XMU15]|uniref:Xre family transcriptional regulator n=3 Tax=Pseudonocardiaceae TaxID=2070 RepID=A0A2N3X154_9PSEU|nr:helix-turn-helix transcriptional regulator [Saccharomonospora marina]EHR48403.1 putative transcriptional regulator [Saccharomonospora marina XMU15]PKV99852.1 Xre family transcriptional regulator [Amycolatopsis niigatensis]
MVDSVSPLAAYRLAAGFTQESLAEQLSIDRGTIGRWERGTQAPQPWQRPDLATSLRISLAELDDILHRTKHQTDSRSTTPTSNKTASADVRRSQQEWLHVRNAPGVRGRELTELAAWLYPESQRAPGGHVLAGPGWLLEQPVPLESVRLAWSDQQRPTRPLRSLEHVLPLTERGELYAGYSRAVRDLVRPRLLENRLSYRLLGLQSDHGLAMSFGTTTFFEVFDVKQALAHEFKAAWLASNRSVPGWNALPLRAAIGDPFDPQQLLMSPGISTLTIRRDRSDGQHRFVLHERDGGKVADGGGLCHVMPAGEFQPSSVDLADVRNDFSLWRNIMREFSEEFLGNPEHDGSTSRPIDYAHEEPFRSFDRARAEGGLRLWHYGLAMEPLELGAVQMTVAVVDDVVFDRLFADLVDTNDEGRVIGRGGRTDMPFTAEAIDRLGPRLSASALTLLRLGWRDREQLLGD